MPGLASGLSNILGTNNAYQAQGANLTPGVTPDQLSNSYNQAQSGIAQQQAFVNALQAQGQLGLGSQTQLTNQLQQQAMGQGPNPAQAALNQSTSQNVANQAALMAGQRGAGANVGLLARQNAQQGAATQQQAVGQGATLQAQQQLAAQQQLQNLAGTQLGQQASGIGTLNSTIQNEQQGLQNANSQYNNAQVGMQSNINNANAAVSQGNQNMSGTVLGGVLNATGIGAAVRLAHGGMVPKYADGGLSHVTNYFNSSATNSVGAPQISPGYQNQVEFKAPQPLPKKASPAAPTTGSDLGATDLGNVAGGGAYGSQAGLINSMGGSGLGMATMAAARGGKVPVRGETLAAKGMKVPGQAKVKGDSLKNDTVNAKLSPGEIVLPRHIVNSADAPAAAAKFVQAILAKQGKGLSRG